MKPWQKSAVYLLDIPIKYFSNEELGQENKLLQEICSFTGTELNADACSIFIVNEEQKIAKQVAGDGYQKENIESGKYVIIDPNQVIEDPVEEKDKLGLTGWILTTGKPLLFRDSESLKGHPHHKGKYDKEGLYIKSFLGVPIWGINQNLVGLIKAEREEKNELGGFSEQDEGSLTKIAEGIGHCLHYYNLSRNKNKKWDAIAAWTLYVLAIASSEEQDLRSFIQSMVKLLCKIANAESCSLFLLDTDKEYLTQYAGCGYQEKGNMIRSYKMPKIFNEKYEGLTTYIVDSKKIFYAKNHKELEDNDYWGHKFDVMNFTEENVRCETLLGIPLIPGIDPIGVIKFENSTNYDFNSDDPYPIEIQRNLSFLTQHVALAILRLQSQANTRLELIEKATKTISEVLLMKGERETMIQNAISEFKNALNAECCALFIKEGNKLIQYKWSAVGYATNGSDRENREYKFIEKDKINDNPTNDEDKIGLTAWIAATGNKFIARSYGDLKNNPHWLAKYDKVNFVEGDKCSSLIGLPLISNGETLGVLKVENKRNEFGTRIPFTKEDELIFDLFVISMANYLYYLEKSPEKNLQEFQKKLNIDISNIWALGLDFDKKGLQGFNFELPPLPNNSVVVETMSLGICGTDIQSFGSKTLGKYKVIEFHEALGKVIWTGNNIEKELLSEGDIVIPIVRRCQTWDEPTTTSMKSEVDYTFKPCKESITCQNYRRPDICYYGEYSKIKSINPNIGYRSRGTGKCHGFGSKYFVDTPEWLVTAFKASEIKNNDPVIKRLILTEPLSVVWKMKRELEQVRPIRTFQDKVLILGLGPIGYLSAVLITTMYPSIKCIAVDRFSKSRIWIENLISQHNIVYHEIDDNSEWDNELDNSFFDIIIETTGYPQKTLEKAISVIAPNGGLALLSVINEEDANFKKIMDTISPNIINAIVKKNVKIIGSVNESRSDFENAINFIKTFHNQPISILDSLMHNENIDPDMWNVIKKVEEIKNTGKKERNEAPKIILNVQPL
jgi:threonine dehydrogenase-like Zn-dependent dehydrogenase/transcriptional regulator with GAF, ATPase, and Fis domain